MSEILKKFGRYFLLDRIAQGGMAEIYRARMASQDAMGRLLVIKRIQTGMGANSEFVSMFKSETKVTMGFNHPNVVQVYDFGEEQDQPYIAMEFVDGRNIRQFINRFTEMKQTFPVDLAAFVIEQAAGGLHYAHSFKDKITGEPLSIIHRDISPQNILISYDGNVKVIDFGIAKANSNSESTRAGVIKGKPSYLSPEQISGDTLDARCDVFALGVVLWEMLTGRKLFSGENDLAVLKMIESCSSHVKPPSSVNSDVPKDLDYIVLKALAKQREYRFQSADELRRALHKFVLAFNPEFNSSDLSHYGKDLFKNEIVEDRKKVQRLYEQAEKLLQSTQTGIDKPDSSAAKAGGPPKREKETTTVFELGTGSAPIELSPEAKTAIPTALSRSGARSKLEPAATGSRKILRSEDSSISRYNHRPQKEGSGGGRGAGALFALAIPAMLAFTWHQLGPMVGVPPPWHSSPSPEAVQLVVTPDQSEGHTPSAPVPVAPATPQQVNGVTLKFRGEQGTQDMKITINGVPAKLDSGYVVAPGYPLELVADRPGFKRLVRTFSVPATHQGDFPVDVTLEPESFGFLTVRSTPSAEAILVNRDISRGPSSEGKPWQKRTPFEGERVPAGTYQVRLVNELLGMEKTVTVVVEQGRPAVIDERLEVKN